ncbi:MAG: hypothetical protein JW720_07215 [Sedimentisphaerales bacterium]|nr:hypothetical protein [Sedimentisphaerales bacterium]
MAAVLLMAILLLDGADSAPPVAIPDQNLKAAIEEALGAADPSADDMLRLTTLEASDAGIADLTGLQHAHNLEIAILPRNRITDISPLLPLPRIKWLDLSSNSIADIPEFSWPRLDCLIMYDNPLPDLESLCEEFARRSLWVVLYPGNRHPDLTPPPAPLAVADGNETIAIPPPVWDRICEYTLAAFQQTFYETILPRRFAGVFGPVSARPIPLGRSSFLYTHSCPITAMNSFTTIIACDADAVSPQPISIPDEDAYLVRRPRISFRDIDLDGRPELVTRDADHFGTNANWVAETYWKILPDLAFSPVLRIRTYETTGIPIDPDSRGAGPYYCLTADLETIEQDTVLVTTALAPDDSARTGEKIIGCCLFEMDHASSTFVPVEHEILLEEYARFLRRANPLEFSYRCHNPDCAKLAVKPQYAGPEIECPHCCAQATFAGPVMNRHK